MYRSHCCRSQIIRSIARYCLEWYYQIKHLEDLIQAESFKRTVGSDEWRRLLILKQRVYNGE
jgi:hypothetical protein